MTPMERALEITDQLRDVLIVAGSTQRFNKVQEMIADAIRAAEFAERERCVQVADELGTALFRDESRPAGPEMAAACGMLMDRIRAGAI